MATTNLSPAFLAQSRVDRIYAAVVTCSVLCTIAVVLRFICRRLVRARLWWDDWSILAALVVECTYSQSQILLSKKYKHGDESSYAISGFGLNACRGLSSLISNGEALISIGSLSAVLLYEVRKLNFGKHAALMQQWQRVKFAKVSPESARCLYHGLIGERKTLVATQLLYYCAQAIIKVSLLLLYHRIPGIDKSFRFALHVAGILTIMWWLASFLDTIFQCIPVQASWDRSIKNAKCQNIRSAALGTGISNLLLDVLFLALPMPVIWRLQVEPQIKVSLTGIFLLGLLCVLRFPAVDLSLTVEDVVSVQLP